jgi:ATP-binding cassette subfamily B protein
MRRPDRRPALARDRKSGRGAVGWAEVLGVCASYWFASPRKVLVFAALLAAALAADLSVPVAIGGVVGALPKEGGDGNFQHAYALLTAAGFGMLAYAALRGVADRTWNGITAEFMRRLQLDMYARVQRFSADWHANSFAGATVHKISRARWALDSIGNVVMTRLLPPMVMIIGVGVMLFLRLPLAGLVFFLAAAVYIVGSFWIANAWVRPANIAAAEIDSSLTGLVADGISNNAAVRAFGAEDREDERLAKRSAEWALASERGWTRGSTMNAFQSGTWAVLQISTIWILISAAEAGRANAADIAFAIAANLQLGGHLRGIGGDIRMLQRGFSEFIDAVIFLRAPAGVPEPEAPVAFKRPRGEIVIDHITFAYAGRPALYEDFSLRIPQGQRVGLVGPSGSGKSTFVKLIQRLYDVDAGAIRIDGIDISTIAQADLRRAIAIVPQDPVLFHRSLAENIAYGRPGASREEIREAARRARADAFIESLPQSYDTLVGERGVKLSGGERQRVALARAFLADAPILILDEATSSLDTLTEQDVQAAIEDLMAERTTIIIAHRLSTVRRADRILVFEDGRVAEQGSHAELLARPGGLYRRLHGLQVEQETYALPLVGE